MIAHTSDFDIALPASEYTPAIKKFFLGHKIVHVFSSLGLVNLLKLIITIMEII